jgi:protein TonB
VAPLSVRAPDYPRRARVAGIEGHVTLSYAIRSDGRVTDVRLEDASPPRTFDRAARDALDGWRFAAGAGGGKRFVQTFDFVLDGKAGGVDGCVVSTGSRLCRPGL